MDWLLTLLVLTGGAQPALTTTVIEFPTEDACMAALDDLSGDVRRLAEQLWEDEREQGRVQTFIQAIPSCVPRQ